MLRPNACSNTHRKCLCCNQFLKSRYQNKFCSTSCAAKINNKLYIKRKKLYGTCIHCSKPTDLKRIKTCNDCIEMGKHKKCGCNFKDLTLKQVLMRKGRYAAIREHSLRLYRKISKSCMVCGYNKHVEICHKKPIYKFSLNTRVEKINDIQNIIFLCPNCHWEFDKGILPPSRFERLSCSNLEHPCNGR